MQSELWALLGLILKSDALQVACAGPVAAFLKTNLPDAVESAIASFLRRIADILAPPAA
jgi:hypothetical protein